MKRGERAQVPDTSAHLTQNSTDQMDLTRIGLSHTEPDHEGDEEGGSSAEEDITDGMASISGDISKARRYFGRASTIKGYENVLN